MLAPTTGIAGMSGGTHNKFTVDDKHSFYFDGVDEYVGISMSTKHDLVTDFSEFSIVSWVKIDSLSAGIYYIYGSHNGNHGVFGSISGLTGWNYFYLKSGATNDSMTYEMNNICDNSWHLIVDVCKLDSGKYRAFKSIDGSTLNNVGVSGDGFVAGDYDEGGHQSLFMSSAYNSFLEGNMSSHAYFSKALSQDEIDALYAGTTSPQEISNLITYCRMGDRAVDSNTHIDTIVGPYTATPYNMEIEDIVEDAP